MPRRHRTRDSTTIEIREMAAFFWINLLFFQPRRLRVRDASLLGGRVCTAGRTLSHTEHVLPVNSFLIILRIRSHERPSMDNVQV